MSPTQETSVGRPRELADVQPGIILRIALVFIFGIAVSLVVMALLFHYFHRIYPGRTSEAAPRVSVADLPPLPRLETAPALDLQAVRAAEETHLSRYAWIDRPKGIAQIPIERAMSLWVETQGATAATNAAPSTTSISTGVTELQMRQDKAKEAAHAP
jgi:hypothetical protein